MSDDELRAVCAPRRWETRLEQIAPLVALVIAIRAVVGVVRFLRPDTELVGLIVAGGCTFFVTLIAAGLGCLWLVGLRRIRVLGELGRRYGRAAHATYLAEDRAAFPADRAPAYTLLVSARALPHGGHHWVRVRLWSTPEPRGRVEVRGVRWTSSSFDLGTAELTRGEAELDETTRAELVALVTAPGAASLGEVATFVRDGAPCTLTVLDRAANRIAQGTCNLAGVPDAARDHPTVRLAEAVMDAGSAVPAPALVTGWCDEYGNIGLAEAITPPRR
jgi:hypothetical protein